MFPLSSTLGIAEGIETALSCHPSRSANTWATLNTTFLKKFRVPRGVQHQSSLPTASKNASGHAAAFGIRPRQPAGKNDLKQVSIRWPQSGDFNDLLLNGSEVYEWVFHAGKTMKKPISRSSTRRKVHEMR